jgi:hypothetical protein
MQAGKAMSETGLRTGSAGDKALRALRIRAPIVLEAMSVELGLGDEETLAMLKFPIREGWIKVIEKEGKTFFDIGSRRPGMPSPLAPRPITVAARPAVVAATAAVMTAPAVAAPPVAAAPPPASPVVDEATVAELFKVFRRIQDTKPEELQPQSRRELLERELFQVECGIADLRGEPRPADAEFREVLADRIDGAASQEVIPLLLAEDEPDECAPGDATTEILLVAADEKVRYALWSDGVFVIQLGDHLEVRFHEKHAISLVNYVDRLAPEQ